MSLEQEINQGHHGRAHRFMMRLRKKMQHHPILLFLYRTLVIGLGGICLLLGLIMLVTPGPGWLFIFLGMSLWATEFTWAHRLNVWAKAKVLGTWYSIRARQEKRHRARMQKRWARRPHPGHFCPDESHYHS